MGYTSRRPHQDHFEEAAYETGRVDGLRRLRSTAVPTQFVFTPRKTPGRTTRRSTRTEEEPCVGGQERVQIDHSYCSKSCPASFEVQTEIFKCVRDIAAFLSDITGQDITRAELWVSSAVHAGSGPHQKYHITCHRQAGYSTCNHCTWGAHSAG
ncbi:uncharacterized protein LOC114571568 isoform X4 [Perca flavescens]|uniref:uncharacterized protein LOC114571568 isoform X4 n=1 Tax=Perca flavescens TaxID=8167 RepID=UPI00106E4B79|nr:uncharacterized protein LOC114571568 isoform X4 [Perca flavescens]